MFLHPHNQVSVQAVNHCTRKVASRSYTITEPGSARLYTKYKWASDSTYPAEPAFFRPSLQMAHV